ncbi:MAG: dihydrolipoyl dehydrogenase [Simkaniaceae bacterium]|nr:dihydrolipoyl dehydrogenase [Simkaniaceae bacterium]
MTEKYDLAVIGSGPGGYVAAIRAAQLGKRVICIEKEGEPGGTCLNVGCIPSKALLYSSYLASPVASERLQANGIRIEGNIKIDFTRMMERKRGIVNTFREGIRHLFKKNGVVTLQGEGSLLSPRTIAVENREIVAENIILATGSRPASLPFLPFDEKRILSSTGALALETVPKKMIVVGAGAIGLELGSVYRRLGSEVMIVEFLDRVCAETDPDLSAGLFKVLQGRGIRFALSTQVTGATLSKEGAIVETSDSGGKRETHVADVILVCIGREPYTENLGLDQVGLRTDQKGRIPIDTGFRTSVPNIFAIGDVTAGPMLAHKASEEGYAVAEILAGRHPVVEYAAIPSVVYTEPEIASVGLTEGEGEKLMEGGIKVSLSPLSANARARCTDTGEGFVKVITCKRTDRIVGMHILASHAGELITQGSLAIRQRLCARDVGETPFAHPLLSEAIKEAMLGIIDKPLHF